MKNLTEQRYYNGSVDNTNIDHYNDVQFTDR